MDEIVKDFLIESNENLDRLDQELVQLESDPSSKLLLGSIFRTIHTIKGSCGFLGFARLEAVAHAGESLLSRLRDGALMLDAELTSALLEMVDAVRHMLNDIQATEGDGEDTYPGLIEKLKQLQSRSEGGKGAVEIPPLAPVTASVPSAVACEPPPPPTRAAEPPVENPVCDKSAAVPGSGAATACTESAASPPSDHRPVRGRLGGTLVERGLIQPEDLALALREQEQGDQRRIGEILVSLGVCRADDILATQQAMEARNRQASAETVRVGVNVLDRLMNLVGELVLARNQLLQFAAGLQDGGFQNLAQRMDLIATELQEEVMKTRMQPIGNVWGKFPRTVRDLAHGCQKEVHLEMEGQDTELDKTIIEAIKDPLTHLVRNAVDHGIESPEARRQGGKDPAGRLTLRAFHEGGQVNIEISDDGAGLDVEKIRRKAVDRGVIAAEHAAHMQDRDIYNLIFLPGLSTADKVTNVSGRGVGMDVVRTNVEKIGGTVDVHSTPGKGTTVRVKIPLTLAIVPALVVTSGGSRFAIPQVALMELVSLDGANGIERVHGAPVCRLRGRLLPLVYLNRELQLNAGGASDLVNVVVLRADERQFGLVVDAIHDTQEIVVKPLRKQLKTIKTFAGASIMGDGRLALILDVMGLAQHAGVLAEGTEKRAGDAVELAQHGAARTQTFLLFSGPGQARMAVPLDTVARLEELPPCHIEMAGDRWVAQYRGEILPLVNMAVPLNRSAEVTDKAARPAGNEPLPMLVCHCQGQAVGVIVERIVDIVEDTAEVQYPATRGGVLYSAVIAGQVTEVLDVPAIMAMAARPVGERAAAAKAGQ